jgi:Ca-activated chloride channel family protein
VTLLRPQLVVLAPLLALIFALALGLHWRRLRSLGRAYDQAAVRRLFPVRLDRFPTGRLMSLLAAGLAIGLAAAGPVWEPPEPPEPPPPLDLAIAVDLSLSMSADDAAPTRIARARRVIEELTEQVPSARFSLVVFAGWPYTLLPPTHDLAVVRYFAQSLRVELVQERDRGSSLSDALMVARSTLESRPTPGGGRAILVLSDGEVFEEEGGVVDAAAAVTADGLQVWVGGLGSETGAPLSLEGEPIRDASGRPITASRNTTLLRAVADAGRGRYEDVTEEGGLESLAAGLRALGGDDGGGASEPLDATSLLMLLAIPLLLWESIADAGRAPTTRRGRREPS